MLMKDMSTETNEAELANNLKTGLCNHKLALHIISVFGTLHATLDIVIIQLHIGSCSRLKRHGNEYMCLV